jgi:hypothetical protein
MNALSFLGTMVATFWLYHTPSRPVLSSLYSTLPSCTVLQRYADYSCVSKAASLVKEELAMAVHAVTLELPEDIYQRAQQVARTTSHSVEEVVCEWIRPPVQISLPELERLSDDELLHIARATLPY